MDVVATSCESLYLPSYMVIALLFHAFMHRPRQIHVLMHRPRLMHRPGILHRPPWSITSMLRGPGPCYIGRLAASWLAGMSISFACLCETPPGDRRALWGRAHLWKNCLEATFAAAPPYLGPILEGREGVRPGIRGCIVPATLGMGRIDCTVGETRIKINYKVCGPQGEFR